MITATSTQTRRCIGSTRFGIEPHDADAGDFPVQPSQKDGLGRMCKPHWREYTNALRKAAVARKAEAAATPTEAPVIEDAGPAVEGETPVAEPEAASVQRTRRAKVEAEQAAEVTEDTAA
jgi:hypothetical protein